MKSLISIGKKAKIAGSKLANYSAENKNKVLSCMADTLIKEKDYILHENLLDIKISRENGAKEAFTDRLMLNEKRIVGIAEGLREVAKLPDPVGRLISENKRPNGLCIKKIAVPLGVIGIIYEARPNVTVDTSALCFKAGNAVILRGGSSAINSNKALVEVLNKALKKEGAPDDAIQLIEDTSKSSVIELMKMREYVDLLIPRGGASLIKATIENSLIPVIETGLGNCHIFVDESADFEMAKNIIINAKTSRPSVCNAAETLLIAESIASEYLPEILTQLAASGVEIRGCKKVKAIFPESKMATEEDWYTEYLDYIISVKIVKDTKDAISHINKYGTQHSEAIITENKENADKFTQEIDSAAVYVNASTRFTDGFEFGMGAEIGISTQKLHARGPMGLQELTSYKYIVNGNGQIR
ncbi:MAG: glutamate-5-semialdehyde dehydrogenase [Atribacterota bacterium]|jgi:glutamate-5-semialdehyde dehydrogenase|nr:glutamate-5-semialdehyde dehydrogenase [Atribacterota bacterium]MDD3031101.1 glutamate-5-semialdehyde dehydrogenase [Atribacterota bacterium]MDD3641485.1 glutamate-5-semialdehyde dehydrogenase [Atribacterota bacterium]MDD4289221.1 glutamate-5-semialdehyde dehydrogenase [Atribacterota bacterium]MDD5635785.1 glutamate-5-semialdehyde dehydrogenase [Atribacterota bacterium]